MTKCLLLVVYSYFIAQKNVGALECYVTDLANLKSQGLNAEPVRKNCKKYFIPENSATDNFRCSTVTAEFDEGRLNLQSCLKSGQTCDDLKTRVKSLLSTLHFHSIKCEQCDTDYCNSGVGRVVVKYKKSTILAYVSIGLIAGVTFLALCAIVVAVIKAVKRKKSRLGYNRA